MSHRPYKLRPESQIWAKASSRLPANLGQRGIRLVHRVLTLWLKNSNLSLKKQWTLLRFTLGSLRYGGPWNATVSIRRLAQVTLTDSGFLLDRPDMNDSAKPESKLGWMSKWWPIWHGHKSPRAEVTRASSAVISENTLDFDIILGGIQGESSVKNYNILCLSSQNSYFPERIRPVMNLWWILTWGWWLKHQPLAF